MIKQVGDVPFTTKDKIALNALHMKKGRPCGKCKFILPINEEEGQWFSDWCEKLDSMDSKTLPFFALNRDEPPEDVCPHFEPKD